MFFKWQSAMDECIRRREAGEDVVVRKMRWFGFKVVKPEVKIKFDPYDTNPKDELTLRRLKKLVEKDMRRLGIDPKS